MTAVDKTVLENLGLAARSETPNTPQRLGQEEFLELMIAQIKNQDPFRPLQSGEFLSQIAQFSTVSGIQDLQTSFNQVANALYSNQALQASTLVGRTVLVAGKTGQLVEGEGMRGAVELDAGTPSLIVEIRRSDGTLIKRLDLGEQSAGLVPFSWDGLAEDGTPAAPGLYEIKAIAAADGGSVAAKTFVAGKVDSVTLGRQGEGITLNLGELGVVDFNEVRQIM